MTIANIPQDDKEFKDVVIIGGGPSIQEGIDKGLKEFLKDKFVIVINNVFKHFNGTLLTFMDAESFYARNKKIIDNYPLVVSKKHPDIKKSKNNYLFNVSDIYHGKKSLDINKIYNKKLTGIFSITLSICLNAKKIYLLGYDFTKGKSKTHFYDNSYYGLLFYNNVGNPNKMFDVFNNDAKIINVSMESNITCFPKMTYNDFLNEELETHNQEELRESIKRKLHLSSIRFLLKQ